uniref:Uncharacterized protein n=1 Tax=Arion vulgaris TaxID=1028688 RepID=A0A0B6ZYW7_9EUPU
MYNLLQVTNEIQKSFDEISTAVSYRLLLQDIIFDGVIMYNQMLQMTTAGHHSFDADFVTINVTAGITLMIVH